MPAILNWLGDSMVVGMSDDFLCQTDFFLWQTDLNDVCPIDTLWD